jgi:SNF2 family DNA or RNA helicase
MSERITLSVSYDLTATAPRSQRTYWLHRPETIDENGDGFEEETIGPIPKDELDRFFRRMDPTDGYTGDSLYRRDGTEEWRPLRAFSHFEFEQPDRLESFQRAGVEWIKWLTAGHADECVACKALEGKTFPITEPPPMPPLGCRCELWCKCILVAAMTP